MLTFLKPLLYNSQDRVRHARLTNTLEEHLVCHTAKLSKCSIKCVLGITRICFERRLLNNFVIFLSDCTAVLKGIFPGFPLRLEKWENLEKSEGIFQSGKSQGILNRLVKSGKNHIKY